MPPDCYPDLNETQRGIEISQQVVAVLHNAIKFIANTIIEGQLGSDVPAILQERGISTAAEVPLPIAEIARGKASALQSPGEKVIEAAESKLPFSKLRDDVRAGVVEELEPKHERVFTVQVRDVIEQIENPVRADVLRPVKTKLHAVGREKNLRQATESRAARASDILLTGEDVVGGAIITVIGGVLSKVVAEERLVVMRITAAELVDPG